MTSLAYLNAPLPKKELNPKFNNLTVSELSTGALVSVLDFKYTSLTNQSSSAPTLLTANQVVSAIFAYNPVGSPPLTLTLPTAAQLAALIPSDVSLNITFEFRIYSKNSTITVNLGADCQIFFGGTSFTVSADTGAVATFYGNSAGFSVFVLLGSN